MELELRDYVHIIRRRLWMIAAIVLVASVVTGVVSFYYLNPVYSASTKLIVNKSAEAEGKDPLTSDALRSNMLLVNTYKEIIKTPAIMDQVAAQYPELALTAEQLIKKVNVSSVNETQVITLSVEDGSHEKAVQIVNAVSEVFKQQIPLIMKVDNVMILNVAKVLENPIPVKPKPYINLAISVVVSLMVAVGLAFLLEYLDDTIKTEADVEAYLALPVLVVIDKIPKDEFKSRKPDKQKEQVGETQYASANQ
ncbi:YveK family protein [Paenibacillus xerothermodurans]|uniref:Lipopolysaccharide biosynthesis protein n=1 Tax=Paenibacillus xerothermodurans TaxID=1977292 RepID=A0A2W1NBL2_PAEXE|nr:Wzz/FepE/Etk N-terminal domain-containing protein [Paenibacillus xerothermodurans]PZE20481.1 lipopolysaccharide biosynthesis protein [Paenibacillus xerothermodurans]